MSIKIDVGLHTEQKMMMEDDDFVVVDHQDADLENKTDIESHSPTVATQVATKEELDPETKRASTPKSEMIELAIGPTALSNQEEKHPVIKKQTCCSSFWKWICCKK